MTVLAFIGMCFAWGFSWIAMKFQVDSFLLPELSLFYRFFSVAILMFLLCLLTRTRLKPLSTEIKFFVLISLCNFCLNFLIGYYATKLIPSGIIAVIFSLSIITSEIIKSIFDGKKIEKSIILSGFLGFVGLGFFIIPTLDFDKEGKLVKTIFGLCLAIVMMIIFSIGNYLVEKNKNKNHTPLFTLIAYCAILSSSYLFALNILRGNKFIFDYSHSFILSLAYQILIASILAFSCLYYLIQKIGVSKANYTSLVYPGIALLVSSFYEDFSFTLLGVIGFLLILFALALEFIFKSKAKYKKNSLQTL